MTTQTAKTAKKRTPRKRAAQVDNAATATVAAVAADTPVKVGPFTLDETGRITVGSRKFTGAHFTTLVETLADLKVHKVDELAAAIHAAVKKDKTPQSELPAIRKLLSNRFAHIRIALKDTRLELVRVEKGVFQIRRRKPRKAE